MKKIIILLGLWLFVFTLSPHSFAVLIWLRDGTCLQGEIIHHNHEKIEFHRFDNDGLIEIPWQHLHPKSFLQIRNRLGLIKEKKDILNIKAVRIYCVRGVIEGKIIKKKKKYLIVKTRYGNLEVPKSSIYKKEKTILPITKVYRYSELYNKEKKRYDLSKGQGNFKFAKFLLQIGHYAKAKKHFLKAQKLDTRLKDSIKPLLASAKQQLEEEEKETKLRSIHRARSARHYTYALKLLKELKDISYEEKEKLRVRIEKEKSQYLQKMIPNEWMRLLRIKMSIAAGNRKLGLSEAQAYASKAVEEEITKEIGKKFQIPPEDALDYFSKRDFGRTFRYSYRDGTFIVGTKKQDSTVSGVRSGRVLSAEDWWKTAPRSTRRNWLLAYYTERNMKLVKDRYRDCPNCKAKGYIKKHSVAKVEKVTCSVCHGCKYERIVEVK